jgi:AcrR family transcriptional regulator
MSEEISTKGERTRRAILDAAYRLFIERGYHATSMRRIAEGAGLALGGIYNHFPSKEDIYKALLLERHPYHKILPVLQSADGKTTEEYIRNAANALINELGGHPEILNFALIEIVEFEARHTSMLFANIFPQILPLTRRIADTQNNLRSIPLPVILRAFLGMFFSYYITDILIASVMPAEMRRNALNHFVDIFLHGIIKPE